MSDPLVALMVASGVPSVSAEETARNTKLAAQVKAAFETARAFAPSADTVLNGTLVLATATRFPSTGSEDQRKTVLSYIARGKITREIQLAAALAFIKENPAKAIDEASFDSIVGVGIAPTPAEIKDAVAALITQVKADLVAQRYRFNFGTLFAELRKHPRLKWADGPVVKEQVDAAVLATLGPKTDADNAKVKAPAKTAEPAAAAAAAAASTSASSTSTTNKADAVATGPLTEQQIAGAFLHFHKVGENYKTENYVVTPKTDELLKKHVAKINGKVHTRFPPEPNGILHIGHAKAMHINFTFARVNGGKCIFRYDDTNPEKEEERFFVGIRQMVDWLGHKPAAVTHTSDYFQELYDLAVELIKRNHAYACHQTEAEVRDNLPSKYRDRPIEESLIVFEDMRKGKYDEGKATLRMKHTMEDGKIDPVAYRIKFHPHFKTNDKWCIYPTYDYSHCLIDSMENITHSMCTKEFQNRRMSYYWLCNALDQYCPVQWEYGRLNMNYTVMSKRKIQKLIELNIVRDWDDPRLFTLMGLRRRGFPAAAINDFCARLGVTMASATVDPQLLESCVRDELNFSVDRVMATLEPLKIVIDNYDELTLTTSTLPAGAKEAVSVAVPAKGTNAIEVLRIPGDASKGLRSVPVGKTMFIDRSDFREANEAGFRRLTPTQPVALKYCSLLITLASIERDAAGNPTVLHVTGAPVTAANKPKAFITWVADVPASAGLASSARTVELRIVNQLFLHKNPEDKETVPGGWLSDVNPNSLVVLKGTAVDAGAAAAKIGDCFQFERFGFFVVDTDTTDKHLVFNQIVTLKEDSGKN
ncbi:glutaminyl-tRNA synthetase [Capsaspora owczarzaki ATCC 30864]|uniref:glutamine--tRNA ligase n=1 Tax=Capsaspora owczarzaki (strain ATCC 30864) TaxID=595528 RepID=A0A0D2WL53_CAPO3|nr:glutaminyl-tRNA synthetase [Capsaspora owczarzaki ATCC 30864]KJE91215.1 glutaminyl-tRNA synthetase [Capsaspora owczarzaki ATCC 30864]|eukprot:XP_004349129.1 glutaminyl-tRNA synthetase [Capsaspora owczarzaki ATCC 30864]